MGRFLIRMRDRLLERATLLVWLSSSCLVTLTGPFGTYDTMGLAARAGFWFATIAVSIVIALGLRAAIRTVLPPMSDWAETLVFAPLLAAVFVPVLRGIVGFVGGERGLRQMSAAEMAVVVLLIPLILTALRRVLSQPVPEVHGAARPEPRILQRLPEESGRRILRISVRDHYVEVVTDRARETILMRFSDAIAEAEGIPGLQVHRSHWVAEDAVTGVDREKGRMFLTLVDGSRVPVSRGFRDAVEEAGIAGRAA